MRNQLAVLSTVVLVLASPLLWADGEDISKVNGSIRIDSGRRVGAVETVNGSIRLEDGVTAGNVETVSGSIEIGRDSTVEDVDAVNGGVTVQSGARAASVETVNGGVRIEQRSQVHGDVTSVNGGIVLAEAAKVGGKVENVNGHVKLEGATVGNGIETTNGDIEIGRGSRVDGGIRVEKPDWSLFSSKRKPKVTIGPDAVVNGTLHFEREVELRISERATVGKIVGATPIRD